MSSQQAVKLIEDLKRFLDTSVCNFIAANSLVYSLRNNGFEQLDPAQKWNLKPNGRYFVVKNHTAVFAFVVGKGNADGGFKIISAHSDSPGFRIKPNPEMISDGGIIKLNTEVYGGPILYTWFDRPLSIAGRVMLRGADPLHPIAKLVKFTHPILTIPHLAIHFNRAVNEGNKLSKQTDMLPVLGIAGKGEDTSDYLLKLIAKKMNVDVSDILATELSLYDTTGACRVGVHGELISSGRIDDLSMVHAALIALETTASEPDNATRVMAIFDNEETGSGTKQGAASPVLANILERITMSLNGNHEDFLCAIANSFMISADNAHAFHPNYASKYDPTNHPVMGGGPVIKINANCKYMTDSDSAAVFRAICEKAGVPCQYFVNHSDVAGGSTLGNILTSQLDLRGVDMGAAVWAMHSVRETASCVDHIYTVRAFQTFFRQ
ncbi:MAG: M18 family aminopeptidase [Muribaculum sp.]|nr:M18 family aminopeptidase [Muribaculaceae bacterium]MCM1080639.1 M18 family aminopeptidase [Muribaculum sp.]